MRLAVYENNIDDLEEFCELMKEISSTFIIEKFSSYQDFIQLDKAHSYDIVFVDDLDKDSKKVVSLIQRENPEQRIVLFSDSLDCIENTEGCTACKNSYNIVRIAKPINVKDIPICFSNKACRFDFYNDNLASRLIHITKKYDRLTFDIESLQIRFNKSNRYSIQAIDLFDELALNDIKYTSYDEYVQINE